MNVLNYVTHELLSPSYRRFPQSEHWKVLKVVASLGDASRVSSRITGLPELLSASKGICAEYSLQDGLKFYCLHLTFLVDFRKQHCLWNIFEALYSWKHVEIPAPEINLCFTPRPPVAGENFPCVQVWVKSCCHGGCHVLSYKDRKSSSYTDHVLFVSHVLYLKTSCLKKKKRRRRNKQTKQNK